jgi:hypothetical protein
LVRELQTLALGYAKRVIEKMHSKFFQRGKSSYVPVKQPAGEVKSLK